MMHLSMDMKIPKRIDACCNFHENVMDLNPNTLHFSTLIVLAKTASAKVLIFMLALALAVASTTKN